MNRTNGIENIKCLKPTLNLAKYKRMIQQGAMGGNTTSQTIDGKVRRVEPIPNIYNDPEKKRLVHIPQNEVASEWLD